MDAASGRRSATPDTAQDLASKYARAKAMLREQIDSNQALRLALREEQRQRKTLADGLEAERAATAVAMRKVTELKELLAQQRSASLAALQVDAQTQATLDQPRLRQSKAQGTQSASTAGASDGAAIASDPTAGSRAQADAQAAAEKVRRQAQADADSRVEAVRRQAQADAEAAVEAVRRQSQAAQQRLCAQMLAALRQLQCEAQELAVQTRQVAQQQHGRVPQRSMAAA